MTIQAQILLLLGGLQKEFNMGMILITHDAGAPGEWRTKVQEMMELVGLPRRLYTNYPNQLSGGHRPGVDPSS